jgi:hypothetical protein
VEIETPGIRLREDGNLISPIGMTRRFQARAQRTKQVVITPMRKVKSSKSPRHFAVFAKRHLLILALPGHAGQFR